MAHFVEKATEVVLENGGICTRLPFESVERMSIEDYARLRLAKWKKEDTERSLHVIRNPSANEFSLLLGDHAIVYKLTDCMEVGLAELLEEYKLPDSPTRLVAPNLPWPLVCESNREDGITVTVKLQSVRRMYRNEVGCAFNLEYWCPDLWFSLDLTAAGSFSGARVAVVKEFKPDYNDTVLYRWPLANVHTDARICYGGANMGHLSKLGSMYEKVSEAISMFMDAAFNTDLTSGSNSEAIIGNTSSIQFGEPYDSLLNQSTGSRSYDTRDIIKLLWAMKEPGAWRQLKFKRLEMTPKQFCRA